MAKLDTKCVDLPLVHQVVVQQPLGSMEGVELGVCGVPVGVEQVTPASRVGSPDDVVEVFVRALQRSG